MPRLIPHAPARPLRLSRRSLTGHVALAGGGTASFESSLERDWILVLDFDPSVSHIQVQPFSLTYRNGSQSRRYTPDVLAVYSQPMDEATVVYEVKPWEELNNNWPKYRPRFKAAVRHCRSHGWRFKILTERQIRTPLLENAKFLRRYRNLPGQPVAVEQLLYTMRALGRTTPQGLLAASYWVEEAQMVALPILWQLIATRRIEANLSAPLTMSTPIWLSES